jgi:hypothetical protein
VVVAEDPATAIIGVLVEWECFFGPPQRGEVDSEVVGGHEGVGVVVAEDPATAVEDLLADLVGRWVVAEVSVGVCAVLPCGEGVEVVLAEVVGPRVM